MRKPTPTPMLPREETLGEVLLALFGLVSGAVIGFVVLVNLARYIIELTR